MTPATLKTPKKLAHRTWSIHSSYSSCSLNEVADMLGLTRERVRQIEAKAIEKLRKELELRDIKEDDILISQ